jgi:class 3 adenylate cyclase
LVPQTHVNNKHFSDLGIIGWEVDEDSLRYDDFPVAGSIVTEEDHNPVEPWHLDTQEVSFLGQSKNYCICFIDIMNSTRIVSQLDEKQLSRYYSTFLNAMATIATNFGAKIIKNAGDCLIFHFPETADANNASAFRNVLECGQTIISAHSLINARLIEDRLPPLNYRISADYGAVEIAQSQSSKVDDLFGSTMNVCAKINSKASQNGMVIGEQLYLITRSFDEYVFKHIGKYPTSVNDQYAVYEVESRDKRKTINPFKKTSKHDSSSNL